MPVAFMINYFKGETIMIEIKHVTKTFGSKKAVDDLDLTIPTGEIIGFIGPNGAEKQPRSK